MARHNEYECAYCAGEITLEAGVIGRDWKVYCSEQCAEAGERLSVSQADQPTPPVVSDGEPIARRPDLRH